MILLLCEFFLNHALLHLYTILHTVLIGIPFLSWQISLKTIFTPILEVTTPFSVLSTYNLYIPILLQLSYYFIILQVHLLQFTMSEIVLASIHYFILFTSFLLPQCLHR